MIGYVNCNNVIINFSFMAVVLSALELLSLTDQLHYGQKTKQLNVWIFEFLSSPGFEVFHLVYFNV